MSNATKGEFVYAQYNTQCHLLYDGCLCSPTHTTHISMMSSGELFFTQIQSHYHRFPCQYISYTYIFATESMFNTEMLQQLWFDEFKTYKTRLCLRFVRRHTQSIQSPFPQQYFPNTNQVIFHANLIGIVLNFTANCDWHRNETITIKFNN